MLQWLCCTVSICFAVQSTDRKSSAIYVRLTSCLYVFCRRNTVRWLYKPFEEIGMRFLKPNFKTDFRDFAPSFPYQLTGGFEARCISHSRGESVLHFLKSRLNVDSCGRYNWPFLPCICRSCNCVQKVQYVYFPRVCKIKNGSIQVFTRIEQHVYPLHPFSVAATPQSGGCSNRNRVSWIRTDLQCRGGWKVACTSLFYLVWHL